MKILYLQIQNEVVWQLCHINIPELILYIEFSLGDKWKTITYYVFVVHNNKKYMFYTITDIDISLSLCVCAPMWLIWWYIQDQYLTHNLVTPCPNFEFNCGIDTVTISILKEGLSYLNVLICELLVIVIS